MQEQRDDNFFMAAAHAEALRALERGEVPVGAVVVSGGRIVARAHNLTEALGDPTAHAEMQAITAATAASGGKYLTDCTLYVTLEPCVMCAGACAWAQLGRVVFAAADPKRGYRCVSHTIMHPRTVIKEMEGEVARRNEELLAGFFVSLRTKP